MSDCDSPQNSGQVTIQLSSDIATETNNENLQGTLLSPSKKNNLNQLHALIQWIQNLFHVNLNSQKKEFIL